MKNVSFPVRLRTFLTGLLFPRRCPVCGGIVLPKGELICPGCVKKLSFVKQPVCKKCGKEITSAEREYCLDCTKHKRSFDYGRALLNYNDTAKKSMADIKYRNRREYLDFYAEAVCLRYGKLLMRLGADALVPVPVHPSRRRQRGFNQAEIFADRIGARLGIPVCPEMLVRRKKTSRICWIFITTRCCTGKRPLISTPGRCRSGSTGIMLITSVIIP